VNGILVLLIFLFIVRPCNVARIRNLEVFASPLGQTYDAIMKPFNYPVTRDFTSPYFTSITILLMIIWLVIVTVINIIAVAYEVIPFTSTSYNESAPPPWYQRITPGFLRPSIRSCDGSTIPLGTGL
jgi:hypothetical protein